MPITRERLKLAPDVPYTLTLDTLDAPEAHSQYTGLEYRFSFTQQPMKKPVFVYLPREARDTLFKTGAQPGEDLEIVKSMRGREASYSVQVLSDATEARPASNLRGNYPNNTTTNGRANGHGRNVQPITQQQQQPKPERGSSHMAQCLCQAIDAAIESMEYARAKGLGLQYTEAQIQDIGVAIFIGDQRNGDRA